VWAKTLLATTMSGQGELSSGKEQGPFGQCDCGDIRGVRDGAPPTVKEKMSAGTDAGLYLGSDRS